MRLFVLGATGGIGRAILEQAPARGHAVTAFVRSPEKLGAPREAITVVRGDPRSEGQLKAALPGHDAVLSSLGPPDLGPTTILGDAARSTVAAMQASGVRRLLVVSAALLFEDVGFVGALLRRTLLRHVTRDAAELERAVLASGLEWTIARPPRLTNGRLTTRYRVAAGCMPASGLQLISRANVAHFLLDELEHAAHARQIVGLVGGGAPRS